MGQECSSISELSRFLAALLLGWHPYAGFSDSGIRFNDESDEIQSISYSESLVEGLTERFSSSDVLNALMSTSLMQTSLSLSDSIPVRPVVSPDVNQAAESGTTVRQEGETTPSDLT